MSGKTFVILGAAKNLDRSPLLYEILRCAQDDGYSGERLPANSCDRISWNKWGCATQRPQEAGKFETEPLPQPIAIAALPTTPIAASESAE
jgi:hypothetical protein